MDPSQTQFKSSQPLSDLPIVGFTGQPKEVMRELTIERGLGRDLLSAFEESTAPVAAWKTKLQEALSVDIDDIRMMSALHMIEGGALDDAEWREVENEEVTLGDILARLEDELRETRHWLSSAERRKCDGWREAIEDLLNQVSAVAGLNSLNISRTDDRGMRERIIQSDQAQQLLSAARSLSSQMEDYRSGAESKLLDIHFTLGQAKTTARQDLGAQDVGELGFSSLQSKLSELINDFPSLENADELVSKTESWIEEVADISQQLVDTFPPETWGAPARLLR